MSVVVGISGGIGVGKSALAEAVASRLNAEVTSFGAFVRREADRRGLLHERELLQELGQSIKEQLGDNGFAEAVLNEVTSRGPVVVDGIRHVEIADQLQRAAKPRRFVLVFLETSEDVRLLRLTERGRDNLSASPSSHHSTEVQVHDGSLKRRSDLVMDTGGGSPEILAERLLVWLDASSSGDPTG